MVAVEVEAVVSPGKVLFAGRWGVEPCGAWGGGGAYLSRLLRLRWYGRGPWRERREVTGCGTSTPTSLIAKKKIYGHLPLDKLSPKGSESGPAGLGLDHLQNRTANKQTTGDREGEKGKEAKQTNTTRGIPLSWSQLVWSLGCGCVAGGAGCRVGG